MATPLVRSACGFAPHMPVLVPQVPDPTIELIPRHEKDLLRNLMQAYRHDLSEYNGEEPDEMGLFDVGQYFDCYWTETSRFPYKIAVGGSLAGFALVSRWEEGLHSIPEFFVLRKHRRTGLGRRVAFMLFDRFAGTWRVSQDPGNTASRIFWKSAIEEYTNGKYSEEWSDGEPSRPTFIFQSGT